MLVQAFCATAQVRILSGACDPLFTPRPLGPFADIAGEVGGELARAVDDGVRAHEVLAALLVELRSLPTVLVLEDLHWADEATLDVLRLLGRRVGGTPSLVVATYRDDELGPRDPLRLVVGGLVSAPGVERLTLPPLSPEAVRELAAAGDVDAHELYRRTGGNPFFVTEALAAGGAAVPLNVRDAVLARAGRLASPARRLLEAIAVIPGDAELALLEALHPVELDSLEECLASGMLVDRGAAIGFRHELARLAVEASIVPSRRHSLHQAVLRALSETSPWDDARLAHHAEEAGDARRVLEHAPAAARRAAAPARTARRPRSTHARCGTPIDWLRPTWRRCSRRARTSATSPRRSTRPSRRDGRRSSGIANSETGGGRATSCAGSPVSPGWPAARTRPRKGPLPP